MNEINGLDIPLKEFGTKIGEGGRMLENPHGEGEAQRFMWRLSNRLVDTYFGVLGEEDDARLEKRGEVPIILDGQTTYRESDTLTLRDLPAVLHTLVVLEAEERWRAEAERKRAERKERDRIRARERRQLKKLGEW
jgi:hypothetical protein